MRGSSDPPQDRLHLTDIVRGALSALPDALLVGQGLATLALKKPTSIDSIGLRIEELARSHGQNIAIKFDDQTWTYAEFNGWANRIAAVLRERGLRAGQRVAVLLHNRPEALAVVTAVVKLGAVAAMVNHNQRGSVLAHSLKLSAPGIIVAGEECLEALDSLAAGERLDASVVRLWLGSGKAPRGWRDLATLADDESSADCPETRTVAMKSPAFHIFTSGTTGLPKASVMTHYRWLRGMAGLGQMSLRLHGDDTLYCPLPLYHNNALTVSWGAAVGAGAALAIGRKFSASRFWDEVRHFDATAFCYIGELCRYLLNQPPSPRDRDHRIRLIVGNGLRPEIWEAFQSRFAIPRINEFYGASESNVAFVNGFGLSKTAGFCPLPFAIVEFDAEAEAPVKDARGFLKKVPSGGVGLLLAEITDRAPFDGYTDAKASNSKQLRNVFKRGDCWFNTGDLVRDQGWRHIQFVDRVGDTFRWKGENVATTEVEAALNQIDGVEQAVVYGVEVPNCDGRAGMASLSCVGERFDGKAVAAALRQALPAYAVPLFIRLRQEQEVTATFKYRKVDLKREGFDPSVIKDPLYLLDGAGYVPLTQALHTKIVSGGLRL